MDPLSCLAIAGAVVQFLGVGCKIVAETKQIYEDGESTIRKRAAQATDDLKDFMAKFDEALCTADKDRGLTDEEQDLRILCVKCKILAQSLSTRLDNLNVKEKHRVWSSLGVALSSVWSKKDILKTQEELAELRSQIDTRLAGLIRSAIHSVALQQSQRFDALDQETQQIVKGLFDLKSSVAEELQAQTLALAQLLTRQEAVVHSRTDVSTRIVVNVYNNGNGVENSTKDIAYEACQVVQMEEAKIRRSIAATILGSLQFSMIKQRMEEVVEAHHETFQWIFQHPSEDPEGRDWDDFVQWLETGEGLYWINGKAGSGKSTLLKMVCHHPRTASHLAVWKGDLDLYMAHFFFWSSGTNLQKSQLGLLRSLLYDILLKVPQLIPVLFPAQWGELYNQELEQPVTDQRFYWEFSTLMQAFQILLVQEVVPMKLCIFVDGLDEYSGLGSELANLFKNAAKAPHVKVCVSSRPLLVFKESFESQQQLRLEDLTRGDIEKYVVDMLKNNERMKNRRDRESPKMQELVGEIVSNASGVFLWVKLIVLDLLKGLENHDSISLLQERLRLLPTDLEALYEHMVFKVASIYRVEASRFYQIIAATAERDDDWRPVQALTILTLFLAEEDKDLALKANPMFLSREEIYDGICETDLRLRSRCGGLLETQFRNSSIKDIAPEMNVGYIHRTVKDYLEGTGIRHILSDRTGGLSSDSFNPHLALMRAYILQLKALQCSLSNQEKAEQLIHDIISYARRVESDLCQPNMELLDCFFQTATWWWQRGHRSDVTTVTRESVLSNENVISLAIKFGLHEFLKARLISTGTQADAIMLNQALYPSAHHDRFVSKSVVENLLELGSDPNQVVDFMPPGVKGTPQSPWQNALTYLAVEFPFVVVQDKLVLLRRWERILRLLLQNGAKTSAYCRESSGPLRRAKAQKLETNSNEIDDCKEDESGKSMDALVETTLTPKEVFEKTFERHTDMLSGLLRLLEAKGPAPASVDEKPFVQIARAPDIAQVFVAQASALAQTSDVALAPAVFMAPGVAQAIAAGQAITVAQAPVAVLAPKQHHREHRFIKFLRTGKLK